MDTEEDKLEDAYYWGQDPLAEFEFPDKYKDKFYIFKKMNSHFFTIKVGKKGAVPKPLSGYYTSLESAEAAIKEYTRTVKPTSTKQAELNFKRLNKGKPNAAEPRANSNSSSKQGSSN